MLKKEKLWMLMFLLVYAFGALSTTQTIPYIKQNGFDEMQQGYLLSSIALFTIVLQIVFGIASDKTGKMKIFFLVCFGAASFASVFLFLRPTNSFWLMFFLVGFIGGAGRCFQSMIDTWALLVEKEKTSFEKDKATGSVGWALGAWAAALICAFLSFKTLAYGCAICAVLSLVCAFAAKDGKRESTMKWTQLKELLSKKEYVVLILIMLVLFAMGCADIYLVVDKIMALGGTSFHIGLKWGLQSLAEAPVFLVSKQLTQRFKMLHLLVFSTLMFGVRFLVYGFIQDVWLLVLCALMQSVTFPIAIYCTKIGIDGCTQEEVKSTAQLFGASVYMGISLLVMPVLTSWLSKVFSVDITLWIVASFSVIALALIGVYKKIIS